jgi:acylphosphatase
MANSAIHVLISGRVQGVGYRAWCTREAARLGLSGWVRNLTDDRVEAVFAGDEERLRLMVESCKTGPLAAKVKNIERREWNLQVAEGFEQHNTADEPVI